MQNAIKMHESVFQETGIVVAVNRESLTVRTRSGDFEGRRALGCLVEPAEGDLVLLAVPPEGSLYVLSVLERPDADAGLSLRSDRDIALATNRTIRLSAGAGVEIATPGTVETTARVVRTSAVEARVSADRFQLVGRFVEAHASTVKSVLGTVDSVLERLTQHVQRSYRFVEELDMTRAGTVDLRARQGLTIKAQNALVGAEQVVTMQAEQIHLG